MFTTFTASVTTVLAQNIGDVNPAPPDGATGDKVNMLLSWLMWGAILASVAGLMVCGAMLGYEKISGGQNNATGKLVGSLLGCIIIGSAAGLVNTLVL